MANIPGAVTDPSRVRGENIELKSGGDTIKGYLARPGQSGQNPGIVVIHEAFGLVEHIRDIARRFANIGYNAVAPDLYSRKGGPSDPNDINTVFPVMFGKSDAEAVQDLEAAADHLRELPGATDKVGVIGFCSGGRQTLLFACSSSKADAAIDCWGGFIHRATPDAETTPARPTPILDLVNRLHCPLFAVFGEEDQRSDGGTIGGAAQPRATGRQGRHDQGVQERRARFSRRLPAELSGGAGGGAVARRRGVLRQAPQVVARSWLAPGPAPQRKGIGMARNKIALIGAGQIGGTLALLAGLERTRRHPSRRCRRGRAAGQGARHRPGLRDRRV